jgi:hypothetical protein
MPPVMTWRQIREAEESGFVEVAACLVDQTEVAEDHRLLGRAILNKLQRFLR